MNIELNLSQKMSISPQMQQSMEVLQMGTQELLEYVRQLATDNPVVEIEEPFEEDGRFEVLKKKLEWLGSSHEEYRVYHNEGESGDEEGIRNIDNYAQIEDGDLYHYLQSQLKYIVLSENIRKAVQYMIGCIDENGYLEEDLDKVAETLNMGLEKAEEALRVIQSLEPAGVGAKNLKECLFLQLERHTQKNPVVDVLVENYLEMLSKNQLEVISKELGISIDEVKEAYKVIRKLNPRPGMGYGAKREVQYQTPDLIVVKFSDYYEVLLNDYFYPKISISSYYRNILRESPTDEVKEYIIEKIKEADWAIKCISQRNSTLVKVAGMIVDQQRKFFESGKGHLIPMNQKNIADALEIHESTVSRAIRGKYLQCLWGIYSLDYFFINGLSFGGETVISTDNVKSRIKEIVTEENRKKPYSDQQITDLLNREGINIARRTVAKYREELNIPGASRRKEY